MDETGDQKPFLVRRWFAVDEVGNADVADLFTVKNFMVHFQLKTEADNMEEPVPVELEGFGEGTYEMLCERVYPVYSKASGKVVDDLPTTGEMPTEKRDAALKALNEALVTERMRKCDSKKPKVSDDPDVAELQEKGDLPKAGGREGSEGASPACDR